MHARCATLMQINSYWRCLQRVNSASLRTNCVNAGFDQWYRSETRGHENSPHLLAWVFTYLFIHIFIYFFVSSAATFRRRICQPRVQSADRQAADRAETERTKRKGEGVPLCPNAQKTTSVVGEQAALVRQEREIKKRQPCPKTGTGASNVENNFRIVGRARSKIFVLSYHIRFSVQRESPFVELQKSLPGAQGPAHIFPISHCFHKQKSDVWKIRQVKTVS